MFPWRPAALVAAMACLATLLAISAQRPASAATSSLPQAVSATLHRPSADGATTPSAEELEVIRLVNVERVKAGLWPLQASLPLSLAARAHSVDMATNGFFDHKGSDGSTPAQRAAGAGFLPYGWGDVFVGENIAGNYFSPAAVVQGWMSSEAHRANILDGRYREIGVGFAEDPACACFCNYWTQDFGSQPKVLPMFVNDGAVETVLRSVKLTLTDETVSAWGSIGPVNQMMLANDESLAGASWQPYTRHVTWQLPAGSGVRTVYARLKDAAGQIVNSSVTVTANLVDLKYRVFLPIVIR